jgi:hypothetical protein
MQQKKLCGKTNCDPKNRAIFFHTPGIFQKIDFKETVSREMFSYEAGAEVHK